MAQLVKAGESAKVKITMKLLKLTGVNDLDIKPPNQIFIEWKRGAKKNNAGKTLSYTANATITLEEAIVTECTLEKQKDGTFFKKLVSFAVKDDKKKKSLCKTILDIATYAQYSDKPVEQTLALNKKKGPQLVFSVITEFISIGGKKLVKGSGTGKVKLGDSDFDLVTDQNLSDGSESEGDLEDSAMPDEDEDATPKKLKKGDKKPSSKHIDPYAEMPSMDDTPKDKKKDKKHSSRHLEPADPYDELPSFDDPTTGKEEPKDKKDKKKSTRHLDAYDDLPSFEMPAEEPKIKKDKSSGMLKSPSGEDVSKPQKSPSGNSINVDTAKYTAEIDSLKLQVTKLTDDLTMVKSTSQKELADAKSSISDAQGLQNTIKKLTEERDDNKKKADESAVALKKAQDDLKAKEESLKTKDDSLKAKDDSLKAKEQDIKKLNDDIKTLRDKSGGASEQVSSLNTEIDQLNQQVGTLKTKLAESEEEVKAKESEMTQLKKKESEAAALVVTYKADIEGLKEAQNQSGNKQVEELTKKIEAERAASQSKISDLEEQVADLEQSAEQGNAKITKLNNKIETLEKNLAQAQSDKDSGEDEYIKSLKEDIESADERAKEAEDAVAEMKAKRDELRRKLDASEEEVDRLKDDLEESKKDLEKSKNNAKSADNDDEIDELNAKLTAATKQIRELTEDRDELETDLENIKKQLSESKKGSSGDSAALVALQAELADEKKKSAKIATLEEELGNLKDKNKELSEEVDGLKNKSKSGSDASEALKTEVADLKKANNQLKSELKEAKEDVESLEVELEDVKKSNKEDVDELTSNHESEIRSLKKRLKDAESSAKDDNSDDEDEDGKLAAKDAEIEQLSDERDALKKKLKKLESDSNAEKIKTELETKYKREISKLEDKIKEHKETIEELEQSLEEEKLLRKQIEDSSNDDLTTMMKKKKEKIAKLKKEIEKLSNSSTNGGDELQDDYKDERKKSKALEQKTEEFNLLMTTVFSVKEIRNASVLCEELKRLDDFITSNNILHANEYLFAAKICDSLKKRSLVATNKKSLMGWIGQIAILRDIACENYIEDGPLVRDSGIDVGTINSRSAEDDDVSSVKYIIDLEQVILALYNKLLDYIYEKLQPLIAPAILYQKKGEMKQLVDVLERTWASAHSLKLFDSITEQLFRQIFYYVNAQTFNRLLQDKSAFCTTSVGFGAKLAISEIAEWGMSRLPRSGDKLDVHIAEIKQACNMLVLDKSMLLEEDWRNQLIPNLGMAQVYKICENFKAESQHDKITPETLLKLKALGSKDKKKLLLDVMAPVNDDSDDE